MFTGEFDSAETIVFWDIQDCPIPDNFEAYYLWREISLALEKMGCFGRVSFWAFGDKKHLSKHEFNGFRLVYLEEDKDERRLMILAHLFGYAVQNCGKLLNFVLIMGDVSGKMDIVSAIHLLKSRRIYNVLLAQPQNASGQLGSEVWLRASLSVGENLITQTKTSAHDNMGSWISRLNQ